jgi:hypothetical protein
MCRIARKVRDKRVLSLIGKFLRAGVQIKGRFQKTVVNGKYFSRLTRKLFFPVFEKKAQ